MCAKCHRNSFFFALSLSLFMLGSEIRVRAVDLLDENFEDLVLNPVVTFQSEVRSREAWTATVPTSSGTETWSIDNSQMPSQAINDNLIGVAEFEGWSFVDKNWWVDTAGDQDRSGFLSATGTVAVADPDEWDDFGSPSPTSLGTFDSVLRISNIDLQGIAANSAKLFFHSSWRPEGNQKASVTAKYSDNSSEQLFLWTSSAEDPNFHEDNVNEAVNLSLNNPEGATSATLEFRLFDARNNWWWAIDNLKMFTGAAPAQDGVLRLFIDRDTQEVRIVNNTGSVVNLRGYSIQSQFGALDEGAATFLGLTDNNWQILDNANTTSLSEGHYSSFPLAAGTEINLGNSWTKFYEDVNDISFEYLVDGTTDPIAGLIEFTGNNGNSFEFLDLNFDGAINILDYQAFLDGYSVDLTSKTLTQAYGLGDVNTDGKHTLKDFLNFKTAFDLARGPGSFAAMAAAQPVPEPNAIGLVLFLGLISLTAGRLHLPRLAALSMFCVLYLGSLPGNRALAQIPLLIEDFEDVVLGQSPEEDPTQFSVWSETGPAGWTIDDSQLPTVADQGTDFDSDSDVDGRDFLIWQRGVGSTGQTDNSNGDADGSGTVDQDDLSKWQADYGTSAETNGVLDWAGWAFVKKEFWLSAADQSRSLFTKGTGTIMVADPDEWEDQDAPNDFYNAFVTTASINIPPGIPAGRIEMFFDSSWRPEGMDDLNKTNNQTATLTAVYDKGLLSENRIEIFKWDSDPESPTFHPDNQNESIANLPLQYDGSATTLEIEFSLTEAFNDWWWAVDNIRVLVPADPSILRINISDGTAELVGGDVVAASLNSIEISSEKGNLNPGPNAGLSFSKPDSIDGPDLDSIVGNSINESWQLGVATSNFFTEFFLDGQSDFTASRSESLGQIFNTSTSVADRDIQFRYTSIFGEEITGIVQYVSSGDLTAVPEPSALSLASLCLGVLALTRRRKSRIIVRLSAPSRCCSGWIAPILLLLCWAGSAVAVVPPPTLDRDYNFGEDEGGLVGADVNITFDDAGLSGMNQLIDLVGNTRAGGKPKYVAITDRPDGVGGVGIHLNPLAGDRQYLSTGEFEALNVPVKSPSSTQSFALLPQGTIDYSFISDRGFQLWVKPTLLTGVAEIVMDTNNHGVFISSAGKFSMRYGGLDYTGITTPVVNDWYHLSVVRPFGPNNGSILYVNGIAEAAATGEYKGEDVPNDEMDPPAGFEKSPLVIGSNTVNSPTPFNPVGGRNYFRGIVDDLEMFVMGLNASDDGPNGNGDFGEFEFSRDNKYAAFMGPTTPGDLNGDNLVTMSDVVTFASNWLTEKELTWTQNNEIRSLVVGDLSTRSLGDFNFDGRVDLADWDVLNSANPSMAQAALRLISQGVPEPGTSAMILVTVFLLNFRRPCNRKSL